MVSPDSLSPHLASRRSKTTERYSIRTAIKAASLQMSLISPHHAGASPPNPLKWPYGFLGPGRMKSVKLAPGQTEDKAEYLAAHLSHDGALGDNAAPIGIHTNG